MISHEDETLVNNLLFLMRDRRKIERKIDIARLEVVKRFDEVDGLTDYFFEQSKRILDE